MVSLGGIYFLGKEIEKNQSEALRFYQSAADLGNDSALYMMGLFYEGGLGVRKDSQRAFKNYVEAASKGNSDAQFKLGVYFSKGMRGVRKNLPEAVRYLKLSTENGNETARGYLLALWSQKKLQGLTELEVLDYAHQASRAGDEFAEFSRIILMGLYADEKSAVADKAKARGWYVVLQRQGSVKLKRSLARIPEDEFSKLTAEQLAASDKWAEACISSEYRQCD